MRHLVFNRMSVFSFTLGILLCGVIQADEGAGVSTKRQNNGCNFLFPKRGPTGATGATGTPGAPGAQGPIGPQGPSGISATAAYASGFLTGNKTGGVITQPTFVLQGSNQNVTVFDNSHYQINVPGDYLVLVTAGVANNSPTFDIITVNLLINDAPTVPATLTSQTIQAPIIPNFPDVETFTFQLIMPLAQLDRLSVTFNSANASALNETINIRPSLQKVSLQP